jgi:hypothetical protein
MLHSTARLAVKNVAVVKNFTFIGVYDKIPFMSIDYTQKSEICEYLWIKGATDLHIFTQMNQICEHLWIKRGCQMFLLISLFVKRFDRIFAACFIDPSDDAQNNNHNHSQQY